MTLALASKPGLTGAKALSIPKTWDAVWFRRFIDNLLKGADVRNAVGLNGITVAGNIASPYATISFGSPVTLPAPVTINSTAGQVSLTVNGASGQTAVVVVPSGANDAGITINAASAHNSFEEFFIGGTAQGVVGSVGVAGSLVSASLVNDLALRSINGQILLASGFSSSANVTIQTNGQVLISPPAASTIALLVKAASTGVTAISASDGTHVVNIAPGVTGVINVDNALDLRIAGTQAIGISAARAVQFPGVSTTASAANAFLDNTNNNNLLRSTSSIRYKTNVTNLQVTDINNVLQMRPVTYTSLCAGDDPKAVHVGFIAEEVAAIDPRLVFYTWSQYQAMDDGSLQPTATAQRIPDGVQYDRLVPLLVGAIQTLSQRIAALEQKTPAVGAAPPLTVAGSYGITGNASADPVVPIVVLPSTAQVSV